jgi:glycerate kinase
MPEPPTLICAPDSFKGTLSASDVAGALSEGVREVLPGARVLDFPMADGGEGTLQAIASARQGVVHTVRTCSAHRNGPEQTGGWLELEGGSCVIELASVAGLTNIGPFGPDPEATTSYPVGVLIQDALAHHMTTLVIAIGGSATVDGGVGLLQALGAEVQISGRGLERPFVGGDLLELELLDLAPVHERVAGVEILIAADVTNPLYGRDGSAAVYAPQKGAGPEAVLRLDQGLKRLSGLLGDPGTVPGDGAAGGVGFGLRIGLGGTLVPGASYVANAIGLSEACHGADLVLTGEGAYDEQTPFGKAAWEVARVAGLAGAPVGLVAGRIDRSAEALDSDPFQGHVSLDAFMPGGPGGEQWELERLRRAGAELVTRCGLA